MVSRRSGVALPAVLLVTALVTSLVVGGLYAVRSLAASGRFTARGDALQSPVEDALLGMVAAWDTAARVAQPLGAAQPMSPVLVNDLPVFAWITRLGAETWWLVAEAAEDAQPGIRRRMGVLVRADSAGIRPISGGAWAELP